MYRFFETICVKDAKALNLQYHYKRMMQTATDFSINQKLVEDAIGFLNCKSFEKNCNSRCKLYFDNNGFDINVSELKKREIKSLKIVFNDSVDYSYKYSDRSVIDRLFDQRQNCDDILIIKNGKVTDTSIANVLLFDGKIWVTPDMPLLGGTCRQRLIDEGRVEVREIFFNVLNSYSSIMIVNALRDFDEEASLSIEASIKL